MKLILKTLLIVFISTFFISCDSDDDQPITEETVNFLKVGTEEFELKSGAIFDYGAYEDLYNFDIQLYSIETRIEDDDIVPVNNSETVSGIYFELFTDNPDNINVGNYDYVDFEDRGNFTYTFADVAINLLIVEDDIDEGNVVEIRNGTLQVLSNTGNYEFEFSGIDEQDRPIEVYYKGSLNYLEILD